MSILDGKALAGYLRTQFKLWVEQQACERPPTLAVVLVGNDPASAVYVKTKQRACAEVGIASVKVALPADISNKDLLAELAKLNHDPSLDGILIQMPLPSALQANDVIDALDPAKDVDGFHPYHTGLLLQRRPRLRPCTPWGIMQLLDAYDIPIRGQHCVIIGASSIVGRPMAAEMLMRDATVTVCHSKTRDRAAHLRQADIVISATGVPGLIHGRDLKEGVVAVDVGIHRRADGQLTGDLDWDSCSERASWITPVPGGVGPMTVAMLLSNTLQAYAHRHDLPFTAWDLKKMGSSSD